VPLQSKWGYQTLDIAQDVLANYSAAGLPLECLMVDIEYMSDNFRTMTFSKGEAHASIQHCTGLGQQRSVAAGCSGCVPAVLLAFKAVQKAASIRLRC
jgi:hypothetical protein